MVPVEQLKGTKPAYENIESSPSNAKISPTPTRSERNISTHTANPQLDATQLLHLQYFPRSYSYYRQIDFLSLPVELILEIFSYLSWTNYDSISQTCCLLRELSLLPNSLASSRYFRLPSSNGSESGEIVGSNDHVAKIHRIFDNAVYRKGAVYYLSDDFSGPAMTALRQSHLRQPFSSPRQNKIVISWVYMSPESLATMRNKSNASLSKFIRARGAGGNYVNNVIVGCGVSQNGAHDDKPNTSVSSKKPSTSGNSGNFDAPKMQSIGQCITVQDIFEAFERDHPTLTPLSSNTAVEVLDFFHVYHAGAGFGGGNHFEMRWSWAGG